MGAGWVVGVVINLVGSIMINAGTNIMKLGHNKRAQFDGPPDQRPPIHKFRAWQLGVVIFVIGNVGNFISFGYAAQSLLAAIGCVQFVSNVLFASFVLKEEVTPMIVLSTICIVGGCVLLVSFGSHTSSVYTVNDLLNFYGRAPYISYLVVGAVMVAGAYALYWKGKKLINEMGAHAPAMYITMLPVWYAIFSAILGTQSVLFSKTLSTLVRATATGDNQFGKWFTWVVLPMFLCSAVFWVTRLNKGLNMFPAMVIVPTMQIAWTLLSIISGMLYFQEYQGMTPLKASMFFLGVATVFAGVFLLTRSTAKAHSSNSSSSDNPFEQKAKAAGQGMHDEYDGCEDGSTGQRRTSKDGLLSDRIGSGMYAGPLHDGEAEEPFASRATLQQARNSADQGGTLQFTADVHEAAEVGGTSQNGTGVGGPLQSLKATANGLTRPAAGASPSFRQQQQQQQQQQEEEGAVTPDSKAAQAMLEGMDTPTRRRLKSMVTSFHQRMKSDFGLDERMAARLAMGLGQGTMPALSIFGGLSSVDMRPEDRALQRKYDNIRSVYERGTRSQQHTPRHDKSLGDVEMGVSSTPNSFTSPSKPSSSLAHQSGPGAAASSAASINPLSNAIDVTFSSGGKEKMTGFITSVEKAAHKVEVAAKKVKTTLKQAPGQLLSAAAGNGLHRGYARMGGPRRSSDDDMQSMLERGSSMEQEPDE